MRKLTMHKIESVPLRKDVVEAMLKGKNIDINKVKKIFVVGTLVIVVAIGMTFVMNNIGDISELMKYNPNKIILAMVDKGKIVEGAGFVLDNTETAKEVIKEGASFFFQ